MRIRKISYIKLDHTLYSINYSMQSVAHFTGEAWSHGNCWNKVRSFRYQGRDGNRHTGIPVYVSPVKESSKIHKVDIISRQG